MKGRYGSVSVRGNQRARAIIENNRYLRIFVNHEISRDTPVIALPYTVSGAYGIPSGLVFQIGRWLPLVLGKKLGWGTIVAKIGTDIDLKKARTLLKLLPKSGHQIDLQDLDVPVFYADVPEDAIKVGKLSPAGTIRILEDLNSGAYWLAISDTMSELVTAISTYWAKVARQEYPHESRMLYLTGDQAGRAAEDMLKAQGLIKAHRIAILEKALELLKMNPDFYDGTDSFTHWLDMQMGYLRYGAIAAFPGRVEYIEVEDGGALVETGATAREFYSLPASVPWFREIEHKGELSKKVLVMETMAKTVETIEGVYGS